MTPTVFRPQRDLTYHSIQSTPIVHPMETRGWRDKPENDYRISLNLNLGAIKRYKFVLKTPLLLIVQWLALWDFHLTIYLGHKPLHGFHLRLTSAFVGNPRYCFDICHGHRFSWHIDILVGLVESLSLLQSLLRLSLLVVYRDALGGKEMLV